MKKQNILTLKKIAKVITEREKISPSDKAKIAIKSVSNPSAQTTTQCAPNLADIMTFEWSQTTFQRIMKYSKEVANLFILQYENGLRVSECLEIMPSQIDLNGSVKIKGKKGGLDRWLNGGRASEYLILCKKLNKIPFDNMDRFYIYRTYKKFGIQFESAFSSKKSVTHALRQNKAYSLRKQGAENQEITKVLGHKSPLSQQYYGKPKTKNK